MFMLRWKGKYPPGFVLQFFWFFCQRMAIILLQWLVISLFKGPNCAIPRLLLCPFLRFYLYIVQSISPFSFTLLFLSFSHHSLSFSSVFLSIHCCLTFSVFFSLSYFLICYDSHLLFSFSHLLTIYLSINLSLSHLSLKFNVSVQLVAKNNDKKVQPVFGIRIIDDNTMSWM